MYIFYGTDLFLVQKEINKIKEKEKIDDLNIISYDLSVCNIKDIIEDANTYSLFGTTKIIIAQRTSSVEDADRIVVMDNGRIDAIGTSAELLKTNKIYREVYLSQNLQGHEAIEDVAGKGATA